MEQRLEMVVCGLVAACGLLSAASMGGSQTFETGRAPLRDVSVPAAAFGDDTGEVHCRVSKGAYVYYRPDAGAFDEDCDLVAAAFSYTNFTETGNSMRVYGCRVSFR